MENLKMPENGTIVRFKCNDDDSEWKQGEYDEQNRMFIEIYSPEIVTHSSSDILQWEALE